MKKLKTFHYFVVLLLYTACSISTSTTNRYDYTYLYDESQKLINPAFKIFHHSADSSTLYYQINSDDVLYGKVVGGSDLKARILIKYKVFEAKNKKVILDSATIPLVNFGNNNEGKILQGKIGMKAPYGGSYPLEVKFRDANKDLNVAYELVLDKRNNGNEQFFLLKEKAKILMKPILSGTEDVALIKSRLIETDRFSLANATHDFSMTPPPFIENINNNIDLPLEEAEEVEFENNRLLITDFNQLNRLQFMLGDTPAEFYFYHYYEGFPDIVEIDHLTAPIRYISTSKEYKKVKNAVNYKKAIDEFWLGLAKDQDRASKMIKEYYRRIETSNEYFTSYKEGWKTDRGIIYIVYGIPTTVYKTFNKETWIYGEENNILSVKFEFLKNQTVLSANDFQLIRNTDYKSNWYRAVDMWRQAKIY